MQVYILTCYCTRNYGMRNSYQLYHMPEVFKTLEGATKKIKDLISEYRSDKEVEIVGENWSIEDEFPYYTVVYNGRGKTRMEYQVIITNVED